MNKMPSIAGRLGKEKIIAVGAAVLVAGAFAPSAEAFTISLVPQSPTINVGDSFTVDVVASDVVDGGAPSIGAYDLNVAFDAALLSLSSVVWGSGLNIAGLGTDVLADLTTPGVFGGFEVSYDSIEDLNLLQPGAFTLFTLTFDAVAAGTSALTLSVNAISNAEGTALAADLLNNASVSAVAPVPLPAGVWLLFSGLVGLGGLARKRSRGPGAA